MTTSTVDTRTKPRRSRRSMIFPLSRDQLLPPGLKGLPKSITQAGELAAEAFDQYDEEIRHAGKLEAEANAAPEHDRYALEAAMTAGEEPPAAVAPAKRNVAAEARQKADALEQVAKQRVRALYDVVEEHREEYLRACRKPLEAAAGSVSNRLAAVVADLTELQEAGAASELAASWHNNPNSASLSGPTGNLPRALAKARDRQARTVRPNAPVQYDLAELLAALERKLSEELGE